ncbi:MAG: pyruvate, phosphate dikinase [Acidimicrobiaceae bacterium]|nr:pyruvate, phosphate dikinase [Acidimicrobiaceae bacterium]
MTYVYAFDHKHRKAPMHMKDLLGGKGANLAEMMTVLKLPVPHGFTVTTDACRDYMRGGWPKSLDQEIATHITVLEKRMGRKLGDPHDPLLVSVRSGAKFSMPGMMDTVLNLGLNDASVAGLAKSTNDRRFAYDSYRRFVAMYGRIVLGVDGHQFEEPLERVKAALGVQHDADIPAEKLQELCEVYKNIIKRATGKDFPQEPAKQLRGAIEAVFRSWNGTRAIAYRIREKISHDLGTAVNVQAMVFGNRNSRSGTGVGFTRNAATGENQPYGDYLINAQGEDVVAGIRNTDDLASLQGQFPAVHAQLLDIFGRLERHYKDMCDTEFTIEDGRLWMLQTRVGKRTGAAALRIAVEMVKRGGTKKYPWKISKRAALMRITAEHLNSVLHPQFANKTSVVTRGLAASPGAAVGKVYFTADDAQTAARNGDSVILVRVETSPEDVHGMLAAKGILTARGGLVSHAAVVARGWGTPAIVGAHAVKIDGRQFTVGDIVVREGDTISLDGATGEVMLGALALTDAQPPEEFHTMLRWADEIRKGKLAVRANADTGEDATVARNFGAEGIGLCRTEHMFLAPDRLAVVRRMILAVSPEEEIAALEELRVAQREDFALILRAMSGLPVTVRLLDPPLHEFLPSVDDLEVKAATVGLAADEQLLLDAAHSWAEVNPMLGIRGVRLGVMKPGLYAMQVRALMQAADEVAAEGGEPIIEVMIPLIVTADELVLARGWVEGVLAEFAGRPQVATAGKRARRPQVTIGSMIETPRAALCAGELAVHADFFSFGTNDLTQMTFGFSRDDVESRMMPAYLEAGLLKRNPFETIDQTGVGELVEIAAKRGRKAKRKLKLGACGEHAGDPESIGLFYRAGLDYVSCSPYRVPIARLAAAQAIIGRAKSGTK